MSVSEPSVAAPRPMLTGWRLLWAALRPAKLGSRITYAETSPAAAENTLVLGVIDDPELAMRLLSVRGSVNTTSLEVLASAFGGLLLAFGFLTRFAAAAIAIQMGYIVFVLLWKNGYFLTPRNTGGFEFALLWGLCALGFAFAGVYAVKL